MSEEKPAIVFEESERPLSKREVLLPDCPIHSVVVYPDRAEVRVLAVCAILKVLQTAGDACSAR